MYSLRPYQVEAVEALRQEIRRGHRHPILQLPTGAGKTVVASAIIDSAVKKGSRVIFLAHRRELVFQCSKALDENGIDHGVVMASADELHRPSAPVQVASIQTLHSRTTRGRKFFGEQAIYEAPPADLVVIDECHHATAATWAKVVRMYPDAIVLGLSATPSRKDGRPLKDIFDVIVQSTTYEHLIENGFLVPTLVYSSYVPDLDGVATTAGDYNEKQLDDRMNKSELVGNIVENWRTLASDRPTVVFGVTINHSLSIRDRFRAAGLEAEHVDGVMDAKERTDLFAAFANGDFQILTNCMVATEGWDCPPTSCAVIARPTKSRVLWRQMAGRIQRPASGKTSAVILDHSGAVLLHGPPDADIDWTLEEQPRKKKQDVEPVKPVRVCPKCKAVLSAAATTCSNCGAELPRRETKCPVERDGELKLYRGQRHRTVKSPDEYARLWVHAVGQASRRGQSLGASVRIFKAMTGRLPWEIENIKRSRMLPVGKPAYQAPASEWLMKIAEGVPA